MVGVQSQAQGVTVKLGYLIVYCSNVEKIVEFYEHAFGLKRLFIHESGEYAEMETGETKLAFCSTDLAKSNLPDGFRSGSIDGPPANFEIGLVTENIDDAFNQAKNAGAVVVAHPKEKPWGQTVAYLRDPEGTLVELATPVD